MRRISEKRRTGQDQISPPQSPQEASSRPRPSVFTWDNIPRFLLPIVVPLHVSQFHFSPIEVSSPVTDKSRRVVPTSPVLSNRSFGDRSNYGDVTPMAFNRSSPHSFLRESFLTFLVGTVQQCGQPNPKYTHSLSTRSIRCCSGLLPLTRTSDLYTVFQLG